MVLHHPLAEPVELTSYVFAGNCHFSIQPPLTSTLKYVYSRAVNFWHRSIMGPNCCKYGLSGGFGPDLPALLGY